MAGLLTLSRIMQLQKASTVLGRNVFGGGGVRGQVLELIL